MYPDKFLAHPPPPQPPPTLHIDLGQREVEISHELFYITLDCVVFSFFVVSFLALTSSASVQWGHDSPS